MANFATLLISHLKTSYPEFHFVYDKRFKYRYPDQIFLENPENTGTPPTFYALQTLHELGHALCQHKDYTVDIERLKIECEAWERAKKAYSDLPKSLKTFPWDTEYIEDSLDTYRNWLHQKSICKKCGLTCYQTKNGSYRCPRCENFT